MAKLRIARVLKALVLIALVAAVALTACSEPTVVAAPEPVATLDPMATPVPTLLPTPQPTRSSSEGQSQSELLLFAPALDSPEQAIASWDRMVSSLARIDPLDADLAPTISAADVALDRETRTRVFAEQVNADTIIGGVADRQSFEVLGVIGATDPQSGDVVQTLQIVWTISYGIDQLGALTELLDAEALQALNVGEHLSFTHLGRTAVFQHVEGANPGDSLFVFTVADDGFTRTDRLHNGIIRPAFNLVSNG